MTVTRLAIATALLMTTLVGARAADWADPVMEAAARGDVEYGSNWYLRGDIGYVAASATDLSASFASAGTNIGGDDRDGVISYGIGIGHDFGFWRADVTLDAIETADLAGTRTFGDPCDLLAGGGAGLTCTTAESATVDTLAALANVYFDLGTWSGFTPYVGAGLGAAYVRTGTWTTTISDSSPATTVLTNGGNDHTALAFALHAGTSYALTRNLSLDIGYRYLSVLDAQAVVNYRDGDGDVRGSIDYEDLTTHEVRAGLRYVID